MPESFKFAAAGIEHRHIFGMAGNLMHEGAVPVGWWNEGTPATLDLMNRHFPDLPRVQDRETLLNDPEIDMILIADIPSRRAGLAIEAMEAGKDVMVDKPGCTTLEQLEAIRECQARTGRIWSVNFSERFEVRSVTRAAELVQAGAIGRVVQTVGLGPHRLNKPTRPDWFFDREAYGGILCDIASHQIDQFLYFTESTDAEVVLATARNYANPETPGLQDFGELALRNDHAHAYVRVDWYTPDALPNWGDGRLTILGTEGYLGLRKYVDIANPPGIDHLCLVNGSRYERIDCSDAGLPYFARVMADVRDRTETAMPQAHAFKVMELALKAQLLAEGAQA
jgi:predicted dehydrogenase